MSYNQLAISVEYSVLIVLNAIQGLKKILFFFSFLREKTCNPQGKAINSSLMDGSIGWMADVSRCDDQERRPDEG